jgi:hypothetical protein
MLRDLTKTYEHPSFFGSSSGPAKHRTTGPRNDLTGILVCRRSAGFNRHPRVSPAFITRPSPPGLAALQTVRGELRFSKPPQDTATEPLRKLTRASPGRSPRRFRALTGTFGFHRHLRVSPDRLRAVTGGPSYAAGLSRPPARPAASSNNFGCSPGASCSPPSIFGCSPGTFGFHRAPSEAQRSPVSPNSPFCGDSIVSL